VELVDASSIAQWTEIRDVSEAELIDAARSCHPIAADIKRHHRPGRTQSVLTGTQNERRKRKPGHPSRTDRVGEP